jgi:putative SOS response-associated peptidase YedK
MPVILKTRAYESWLDPANQDVVEVGKMLKKEILTDLVSYPVRIVGTKMKNEYSE